MYYQTKYHHFFIRELYQMANINCLPTIPARELADCLLAGEMAQDPLSVIGKNRHRNIRLLIISFPYTCSLLYTCMCRWVIAASRRRQLKQIIVIVVVVRIEIVPLPLDAYLPEGITAVLLHLRSHDPLEHFD